MGWSSLSLFLSRFNFEDETPTTNFDSFPAAIMTVFQVYFIFIWPYECLMCSFYVLNCKTVWCAWPVHASCRFWQERIGMQWCIMALSPRVASGVECSPRSTSLFLHFLETVSCPTSVQMFEYSASQCVLTRYNAIRFDVTNQSKNHSQSVCIYISARVSVG